MTIYQLLVITSISIYGCSQNAERVSTANVNESVGGETRVYEKKEDEVEEKSDWELAQDSLRAILVASKPNEALKGSILEELYIRNLIEVVGDELVFQLKFNLHGLDCGAPDGYSTDIEFSFPLGTELQFPSEIPFSFHEHGVVERERRMTGTLRLVEWEENFVNYYSPELRCNLLIVGKDKRREYVFYFPDIEPDTIKGNNLYELLDVYDEEEESAPYRIHSMMPNADYRYFMEGSS